MHRNVNQTINKRVRRSFRSGLKCSLGVGFCVATAVLLSVFLRGAESIRFVAPMICLQVVIVVSLHWGRLTGLIGSVLASLTFDIFLFPPSGLAIHDSTERLMLLLLLGGAVCVAALVPRKFPRR